MTNREIAENVVRDYVKHKQATRNESTLPYERLEVAITATLDAKDRELTAAADRERVLREALGCISRGDIRSARRCAAYASQALATTRATTQG